MSEQPVSENRIVGTVLKVAITDLIPNDWNPKDNVEENDINKEQFQELKKTIQEKGYNDYIKSRTIEKDGVKKHEIVDGFHRWKACSELGFKELIVIDYGNIPREQAIGITLDTIYIRIPPSEILTAKLLKDLKDQGIAIENIAPFDTAKLEEYLQMANYDWQQADTTGADSSSPNEKKCKCPSCGHIFSPNNWLNDDVENATKETQVS